MLPSASKLGNETIMRQIRDQSLLHKKNFERQYSTTYAARFGHRRIGKALVHFQQNLPWESWPENGGGIVGKYS